MDRGTDDPSIGGPWPEPRLRALQVDELYRMAPTAAAFSYLGALLTLGVLIETGDTARGAVWFLWATAVTCFRMMVAIAYRRRGTPSDPEAWARLAIAGNLLAGLQWGALGTLLFPEAPVYRQLFTVMVVTCFVGGSLPAYTSVRGAHEALALTAGVPMSINLFFVQDGVHGIAGAMALFFCFAIVYYARKLNRYSEARLRLAIERDELVELSRLLNEKLEQENRELAHRAAVRGASVESAREHAARLASLFEGSPLPQIECDSAGRIVAANAAAQRFLRRGSDALLGKPFASLLSGDARAYADFVARPRAATLALAVDIAGDAVACRASFAPLASLEGRSAGFGVILTGMTVAA